MKIPAAMTNKSQGSSVPSSETLLHTAILTQNFPLVAVRFPDPLVPPARGATDTRASSSWRSIKCPMICDRHIDTTRGHASRRLKPQQTATDDDAFMGWPKIHHPLRVFQIAVSNNACQIMPGPNHGLGWTPCKDQLS
jgi:hypothetical protein